MRVSHRSRFSYQAKVRERHNGGGGSREKGRIREGKRGGREGKGRERKGKEVKEVMKENK